MLENKIPAVDNHTKHGGMGPNICLLCCQEVEIVMHLMVLCPFTRFVWQEIKKVHNITAFWEGAYLNSCFQNWFNKSKADIFLPVILCWELRIDGNSILFQDNKNPSLKWYFDLF